MTSIDYNSLRRNKQIGQGTFGTIYHCVDEKKQSIACKVIPLAGATEGLPNVLEMSIMTTIQHPHLATATLIRATTDELVIYSELATCDLNQYIKTRPAPDLTLVQRWGYQLAQGLSCLHRNRIIHGDIKPANCLLFGAEADLTDTTVKLTDFTLATKQWTSDQRNNHTVCTMCYRPPEGFAGPWSYPLDIWSLACTLYELAYGSRLFPYQGSNVPIVDPKKGPGIGSKMFYQPNQVKKTILRSRMKNCLIKFGLGHPLGPQNFDLKSETKVGCFEVSYAPRSADEAYRTFNDLIFHMLLPEKHRIDIETVLRHPFFNSNVMASKPICYITVRSILPVLSPKEQCKAERYTIRYTDDPLITKIALELYSRAREVDADDQLKAAACVLLANKLVYPTSEIKVTVELSKLLLVERRICEALTYRLHNMSFS